MSTVKNKIVLNKCYGGYGLSAKAIQRYCQIKYPDKPIYYYNTSYNSASGKFIYTKTTPEQMEYDGVVLFKDLGAVLKVKDFTKPYNKKEEVSVGYVRTDPILVQVVEELGAEANGEYSELFVQEFEGNKYRILEHDGFETLETPESIVWNIIN